MAEYVDFNAFSDLTRDDEERKMADALQRAEVASQEEAAALARVNREARGEYGPGGFLRGGNADVSKVGSYDDYVKLRDAARQSRAAVGGDASDWRRQAVRDSMADNTGMDERAAELGAAASFREGRAMSDAKMGAANRQQAMTDAAAQRQADFDAAAQQRQRQEQWVTDWKATTAAKQGEDPGWAAGVSQFLNLSPSARFVNFLSSGSWEFRPEQFRAKPGTTGGVGGAVDDLGGA